ncbi:MAG: glycosyltransferase [Erysipelotrichaceae bacterium]|nr:glycosyltransferase [Erysipelotrichaceae bacterium]
MKTKLVEFIGRIQDGGAETLVKDYALLLDKELFDVTVLCEDYVPQSNVYKQMVSNHVKIVAMYKPSFFISKVLARLLGKKYVAALFRKAIRQLKPDVIHAHLEMLEIMYHARDCLDGIKLLFTCHNPPKMLIGDQRPKERDACRYLLDHNDLQIIALHQDMANEINEMFHIGNCSVIRNGVDFAKFRDVPEDRHSIREELGIADSTYVIGQIGRFTYQKNPEFTVHLFKKLLEVREDACLLLIGRGKQENELRQLIRDLQIEDKAKVLINREDIPRLLKAMDVFILPSRFEGLGIVLIEAQVAGIPCVVSDQVPEEAYQSPNITRLRLDDDTEKWIDALLHPKGNIKHYGNLDDYDMRKEIRNLEKLYLKK